MLNCVRVDTHQQNGPASSSSDFSRYAIYYTPRPGTPLAAFGRSWFGRANDGATLQAFSTAGLSDDVCISKIAPLPGRYTGLHALFLAPFALRDDALLDDVRGRLIDFAAHRKPVATGPLMLARAGRYLVLRPVESRPELDWLAAQCINAFEAFAAEPGEPGDEYRHLSPYQRLLLKSFGHPQVMSEYRFSIALTGPLDAAHLDRVSQALWPVLEDICAEGVTVDGLSLFGDTNGRMPMRLIGRYKLSG